MSVTLFISMVLISLFASLVFPIQYHAEEWYSLTRADNTIFEWSEDTRLTNNPSSSIKTDMVVDSLDNVHVVWQDERDGNEEIYYGKLDSNGNIIINDTRLTSNSELSENPKIAVDPSNDIHIVWADGRDGYNDEIYYKKLDGNNASTIVNDKRLTIPDSEHYDSNDPDIATDSDGNVHIVWQDGRKYGASGYLEIYYEKLDNDGNILIDNKQLTDFESSENPMDPDIAVDSLKNLHLVYDTWDEIYYKKLDNDGNTLVADIQLTNYPKDCYEADIAADLDNNVHITWWMKTAEGGAIYYTKLSDVGYVLIEDIVITDGSSGAYHSTIDSDSDGDAYICWGDNRDDPDPNDHENPESEIYLEIIDGDDGSFLLENSRVTRNLADSAFPIISINKTNYPRICWVDNRDSNFEIYLKYGIPNLTPTAVAIRDNAEISTTSLNISWTENLDHDFSNYEVHKSTTSSFTPDVSTFVANVNDQTVTSYNITDLTDFTSYYVKIIVIDEGDLKAVSNEKGFKTKNAPPTAVTLLNPEPQDITTTSAKIEWTENPDHDFLRYEVHISSESGFIHSNQTKYKDITSHKTTTFEITDLEPSTSYYIKIVSTDEGGSTSHSNEIGVTTDPGESTKQDDGNGGSIGGWILENICVAAIIGVITSIIGGYFLMKRFNE